MIPCIIAALLAQAPVGTTPGTPPAAPESTLTGTVTLGAIVLTGNSQTTSFSFGSALTRTTPDWIYGFKATASYGRSTDPTTAVESTTALNAAAAIRGARRFGEQFSVYLEANADADHLKSIEGRPAGEAGVSYQAIDHKDGDFQTAALRFDVGFRGGKEYRFQYFPVQLDLPDQTIAAPKLGVTLRYAVSHDTVFGDEAVALVNIPDGPRLLLTNVAKLSTRLYRGLTFAVSYGLAEDSQPPPGKKQLDTTLTVALESVF